MERVFTPKIISVCNLAMSLQWCTHHEMGKKFMPTEPVCGHEIILPLPLGQLSFDGNCKLCKQKTVFQPKKNYGKVSSKNTALLKLNFST